MINTQGVLDAVTNMQQNAQAALPVIPNNGNPQGANNMAAAQQQAAPMAPAAQALPPQPERSEYYYSWLAPSPHMQALASRIGSMQATPQPATLGPPQPPNPVLAQVPAQQPQSPVMPYFRGPLP